MDEVNLAGMLHILGQGGVTTLLLLIGYGIGRLIRAILEW